MSKGTRIAVVAVGGNALILGPGKESIRDQAAAAEITCRYVADIVEQGWTVVLTHGNGPQVGFILRRSGIAKGQVPEVPVDYADADTQGAIGYMFQRGLYNELQRRGVSRNVVALVTQVRVAPDDPAFQRPTKPIGAHMDEDTAKHLAQQLGWTVAEDAGRGWRRVIASPEPKEIVELDAIRQLVTQGFVLIACGGGGIPVMRDERGDLRGLEAVIDKDLASSLLAQELGAQLFVVSTSVERVAIHFNTPQQQWLDDISLADLQRYAAEGHFPAGSMGPKIEAIRRYLTAAPQGRAIITDPPNLGRALAGATGTRVHR
ncbi:MAG TPA: carbamate kinase [Burkholderiales bacterium]|nr:carbamate kinase [Burkholderiales bacterium]